MKKKEHLSFFGCGPAYGAIIITLTVLGAIAGGQSLLSSGRVMQLKWIFWSLGIALIIAGVIMWTLANFHSRLDSNIISNTLVTTGVYAWVRNPIYSAFMFACTGVLLFSCNLWLLLLPLFYWGLMTIMVSATEEKWLRELYGQQYVDYCARVNRCIPWFPKV
ncbi:MAG: isoprenylcysteine carboxylmethyltransferase family protein [Clostridia bacterium]|nr:isoprenylcysteine carboxylmethyltransferase family protein [Clostridia bacterium]